MHVQLVVRKALYAFFRVWMQSLGMSQVSVTCTCVSATDGLMKAYLDVHVLLLLFVYMHMQRDWPF